MEQVLIVRYGEISLKGNNRHYFENKLVGNLQRRLRNHPELHIYKFDSRIYIDLNGADPKPIIPIITMVFGVVSVSLATRCSTEWNLLCETVLAETAKALSPNKNTTFKVQSRRGNKKYPLDSLQISQELGALILDKYDQLTVDVHQPEFTVYVEIRDVAYVYTEKIPGYAGLPYGTAGKGLLLLSGGIDSPVAGWMMARRGLQLEALHFHSYPFTSERAKEKVMELARILSLYCRRINLHSVNLLEIQTMLRQNCPEELFTILSRRFMMFIANQVAADNHCEAIVTGENLAQVASQTVPSLHVTNAAAQFPVFRPLIALDKKEIVAYAEKIGTYETSILPFEDCCTVFVPKHPSTHPILEKVEAAEALVDKTGLIEKALADKELLVID